MLLDSGIQMSVQMWVLSTDFRSCMSGVRNGKARKHLWQGNQCQKLLFPGLDGACSIILVDGGLNTIDRHDSYYKVKKDEAPFTTQ
jgi:hypothetical protein